MRCECINRQIGFVLPKSIINVAIRCSVHLTNKLTDFFFIYSIQMEYIGWKLNLESALYAMKHQYFDLCAS